jgi:hypothetical protein
VRRHSEWPKIIEIPFQLPRYNIVFTVSTYLIPVIVMGACYSRMGYVLWRGKSIGEQNQRQAESIQSKHKVYTDPFEIDETGVRLRQSTV